MSGTSRRAAFSWPRAALLTEPLRELAAPPERLERLGLVGD